MMKGNPMRLPSFLLPRHLHADWFELWLHRFLQQAYPLLNIVPYSYGTARLYELKNGDQSVVELAVLPRQDNRLEVRVARLRAAELYDFESGEVYWDQAYYYISNGHWRVADLNFCLFFYTQVEEDFRIDLSNPRPYYRDGIIRFIEDACRWQLEFEKELLHTPADGYYQKEQLADLRSGVHLGVAVESMDLALDTISPHAEAAELPLIQSGDVVPTKPIKPQKPSQRPKSGKEFEPWLAVLATSACAC
jgi:hypothetical protein